jgi:hypothetical protein
LGWGRVAHNPTETRRKRAILISLNPVIKTRTKLLALAGIVFVVVLGIVFLRKVHYVDVKPAIAFGQDYFTKLQENQVDEAFAMYTDGFLQKRGEDWKKILLELETQSGGISDFKMLGSLIAPVTLRNTPEIPCVLVRYQVTRGTVISEEVLTICPHQRGDEPGIAGHEITRRDTGQHFEAGLTVRLKTIVSTN